MKKAMILFTMVGLVGFAAAQSTETENKTGETVRKVAQETESAEGKGQMVAETAKVKGTEMSSEAQSKERPAGADEATRSSDNKGQEVKGVAIDETLTGKAKGEAVKATAATTGEAKRAEKSRAETGKAKRNAQTKSKRTSRPESGARRPSSTGRPASTGRPGN